MSPINKEHPIKLLISKGEGVDLDFKQEIQNPRKIAKSMVSFANTQGGILLIGVRDNGSIAGIKSEDEFHMLSLAATFHSKPEIEFSVQEYMVDGKTVLKVNIPRGEDQPYYAKGEDDKWWVYVRVNDKCILASKTTVDFMHNRLKPAKVTLGKIEQSILIFVGEREKTTLDDICNKFNLGKRRTSRILVDLMRLQAIRSHTTEKTEFYTSANL
jgi:predicted HTH transcriptional regulator